MIIYGWNSKNIKQADMEAYQCPSCGQKQSVLAVFAHYFHIFWIPLFPFKKSARIVCGHCQLSTEEKAMPDEMKATIKQLKSAVSLPKGLFSGLILIFAAVAFFSFRNVQNSQLEQSYLEKPQTGDVYVLKDQEESSEYNHYLMKINEVEGDSLYVSFTSFSYNGVVTQLDTQDGFYDLEYVMHKGYLDELEELGQVKKVIRDYSAAAGFDRVIKYDEIDTLTVE